MFSRNIYFKSRTNFQPLPTVPVSKPAALSIHGGARLLAPIIGRAVTFFLRGWTLINSSGTNPYFGISLRQGFGLTRD